MMGIIVQDLKVLRALLGVQYHPKLIALAMWFCVRHNKPKITSAYRKDAIYEGDSRIHSTIPCRALDFSIWEIPKPRRACFDINLHWHYDSNRPEMKCARFHDVGLGAHIHLQVHENTVYDGLQEL